MSKYGDYQLGHHHGHAQEVPTLGLIMIIISLRFSRKIGSKRWSFFAKKWRDYRYFVKNQILAIIAISRFALGHSTALCPLYGPTPLQPSVPLHDILYSLRPYVPSTALCHLYGHLSPLRPSPPSTALCSLYGPVSSLWPSVSSTATCPLYHPLSPLQPTVPSIALCPLEGPLSSLRPSVSSTALCPLYGPLSPLWPSVPSTALWKQRNYLSCFVKYFTKHILSKLQGLSWSISY